MVVFVDFRYLKKPAASEITAAVMLSITTKAYIILLFIIINVATIQNKLKTIEIQRFFFLSIKLNGLFGLATGDKIRIKAKSITQNKTHVRVGIIEESL